MGRGTQGEGVTEFNVGLSFRMLNVPKKASGRDLKQFSFCRQIPHQAPACLQLNMETTVLLKPGEADRIVAGHPWVYSNEIQRLTHPPADGDLVQVKDSRQRLLGSGFFNSKSKIAVRILSLERIEANESFFEERIRAALAIRKKHLPAATSFRVVNAESDFLSGLIVDKYEDVLVVQISSLGMDQRKPLIVAVLQKIFSPRAILERSDMASSNA